MKLVYSGGRSVTENTYFHLTIFEVANLYLNVSITYLVNESSSENSKAYEKG